MTDLDWYLLGFFTLPVLFGTGYGLAYILEPGHGIDGCIICDHGAHVDNRRRITVWWVDLPHHWYWSRTQAHKAAMKAWRHG